MAIETHGRKSAQFAELQKIEDEVWFVELSNYRNFAHRCFLVSQGAYSVESRKLIARMLIPARRFGAQRMIPDGLVEFRDELHKAFERVLSLPTKATQQTSAN